MEVGDLDRRITIERNVGARNALGEIVPDWREVATVWASKKDVSDRERFASAQVAAEITTRFQIRHSSRVADVNPKDRIRFAGRLYDIAGVREIGRREGVEITATARADN